jgi:hypothetical protein
MTRTAEWSGTLRFFPSDPDARIGIARQIAKFVANEAQLTWLVDTLPTCYSEWPAMLEVRAFFCTKFKPLDGVEAALGTKSPAFGSLCPDLSPQPALGSNTLRSISGELGPVTVDPEMQKLVERCMRPISPKIPTRDDIDAIKAEQQRNQAAKREDGIL